MTPHQAVGGGAVALLTTTSGESKLLVRFEQRNSPDLSDISSKARIARRRRGACGAAHGVGSMLKNLPRT
jgi:hypothetical protein